MRARILLFFLLIAAIGYFLYVYESPEGAKIGDTAFDFSLPTRNETIHLADYRGKVVLLNFWATWCPPCVREMPSLEMMRKQLEGDDFKLLAVSVDEAGWSAIDTFLSRVPVEMTIVSDAKGEVSAKYGTYQLPESYLIGRDGRILKKYIGPREWAEAEIVEEIKSYAR